MQPRRLKRQQNLLQLRQGGGDDGDDFRAVVVVVVAAAAVVVAVDELELSSLRQAIYSSNPPMMIEPAWIVRIFHLGSYNVSI